MIVKILLFYLIANTAFTYAWFGQGNSDKDKGIEDSFDEDKTEDTNGVEDENGYEPEVLDIPLNIQNAVKYIFSRKDTWDEEIARIAILLPLIDKRLLKNSDIVLIKQKLNSEIIMNLVRNKHIPLHKYARYVMGLTATCQNASDFYGRDMLKDLLIYAERNLYKNHTTPVVAQALCVGGILLKSDLLRHLYERPRNTQFERSYGSEAYSLIAAACAYRNFVPNWKSYFESFLNITVTDYIQNVKDADACSEALMLQLLNAWPNYPDERTWEDIRQNLTDRLNSKQEDNGSFGSFLATYYAIPALIGKSFYDISKTNCSVTEKLGRIQQKIDSENRRQRMAITITLRNVILGDNSITIIVPEGWTLMDALTLAASKNPLFRFKYDETVDGKKIYEIANLPNDGEKRLYWQLRKHKGHSQNDSRNVIKLGIDKIVLNRRDTNFILEYKNGH